MSLATALERLRLAKMDADATAITDNSAGYSAGLRAAIRIVEEEMEPLRLHRPTKPVFEFNTEEEK